MMGGGVTRGPAGGGEGDVTADSGTTAYACVAALTLKNNEIESEEEEEDELSVKTLVRITDEMETMKVVEGKKEDEEKYCVVNSLGHDRSKKERSLDVQNTGDNAQYSFDDLLLKPEICAGLKKAQFFIPSPIQMRAIPLGKMGFDLILQAKSGTGKTCAFGTIILQQLDIKPDTINDIQALILSPTREIADQNKSVLKAIGSEIYGLKVKVFIGGTSVDQSKRRSKTCNVASGTPGRILHMINVNEMDLSKVKIIVLDEADRLMEASFIADIEAILEAWPKEKQMIAASATYPAGLKGFVTKFMRNPEDITTDICPNLLFVDHFAVDINKVLGKDKVSTNSEEIFANKLETIWEILKNVQYTQAIIFSRFLLKAQKIFDCLKEESMDVALLTGALSQYSRLNALRTTKEGKCKILVASDLATRGIDCEGVDLVINCEIPDDASTFVHRFGRAGRFGSSGISITLMSFPHERRGLSELLGGSNLSIRIIEDKEQLQNVGKGRCRKLPKLFVKRDQININDAGNENWKEMLDHFMTSPLEYPSLTMDAFAGFKLTVDFSDIMSKVEDMKSDFDDL